MRPGVVTGVSVVEGRGLPRGEDMQVRTGEVWEGLESHKACPQTHLAG